MKFPGHLVPFSLTWAALRLPLPQPPFVSVAVLILVVGRREEKLLV